MQKGGAQYHCARRNIGFCAPDTSPRGAGVSGEDDTYDFGTGAGFYLDATQVRAARERSARRVLQVNLGDVSCDDQLISVLCAVRKAPYHTNYRMYEYVVEELPEVRCGS
eukprot:scaffold434_cov186-Pinguiococcus_pyrenoidosus.AAC.28